MERHDEIWETFEDDALEQYAAEGAAPLPRTAQEGTVENDGVRLCRRPYH